MKYSHLMHASFHRVSRWRLAGLFMVLTACPMFGQRILDAQMNAEPQTGIEAQMAFLARIQAHVDSCMTDPSFKDRYAGRKNTGDAYKRWGGTSLAMEEARNHFFLQNLEEYRNSFNSTSRHMTLPNRDTNGHESVLKIIKQ